MPPTHRLLVQGVPVLAGGASSRSSGMRVEANPQQPAAAFLLQHQVQGRALLPGAAMFESCYAAAHMLTGTDTMLHFVMQHMRICFCPLFKIAEQAMLRSQCVGCMQTCAATRSWR